MVKSEVQQEDESFITIKINYRVCRTQLMCSRGMINQSINQSIHWHVQNVLIPCRCQEPLPFLPVIHFFLPLLSTDHSSILPHFIQPSISWSPSWSCCFQIHIQYSFGNPIFFHSLKRYDSWFYCYKVCLMDMVFRIVISCVRWIW